VKGVEKMAEPKDVVKQIVTVHGYFDGIEQRTQCQNAHFQLCEF
jgi:hypothetical protein